MYIKIQDNTETPSPISVLLIYLILITYASGPIIDRTDASDGKYSIAKITNVTDLRFISFPEILMTMHDRRR